MKGKTARLPGARSFPQAAAGRRAAALLAMLAVSGALLWALHALEWPAEGAVCARACKAGTTVYFASGEGLYAFDTAGGGEAERLMDISGISYLALSEPWLYFSAAGHGQIQRWHFRTGERETLCSDQDGMTGIFALCGDALIYEVRRGDLRSLLCLDLDSGDSQPQMLAEKIPYIPNEHFLCVLGDALYFTGGIIDCSGVYRVRPGSLGAEQVSEVICTGLYTCGGELWYNLVVNLAVDSMGSAQCTDTEMLPADAGFSRYVVAGAAGETVYFWCYRDGYAAPDLYQYTGGSFCAVEGLPRQVQDLVFLDGSIVFSSYRDLSVPDGEVGAAGPYRLCLDV